MSVLHIKAFSLWLLIVALKINSLVIKVCTVCRISPSFFLHKILIILKAINKSYCRLKIQVHGGFMFSMHRDPSLSPVCASTVSRIVEAG